MSLILSLSTLNCISFNIVSVGVASYIFDFATFIGTIKCCSKDMMMMMMIKLKKILFLMFLLSSILFLMFILSSLPGQKKTKLEKFLLFVELNVEENDLYNLIIVELV